MSALLKALSANRGREEELGGQMSFLEHLDELRRRLIRSFAVVIVAAALSWMFSGHIYSFLAAPVERALADAQRRQVPIAGQTGTEMIAALSLVERERPGTLCLRRRD